MSVGVPGPGSLFLMPFHSVSGPPIHGPLERLPESPEASDDWLSPG